MLNIENVSKIFEEKNSHQVLENISMTMKEGEFACVLGPSGCGKSVFLYLLAGFLKPTQGKILLDEKPIEKPTTERILIFQDYTLFPWRTVYENILFGLEKTDLAPEQKNELVLKYLDMVGLKKFKDWHPHTLSGGMKQRAAIARALISNPKVLLMDEPFSALDPEYRKYMRQSLEKIWQKNPKIIIFVTHSINEAIYLADTIYLFSSLPAKIKNVYRVDLPRPRDPRSKEFLAISRDIETQISEEFNKMLEHDPFVDQALKNILKNSI